MYITSHCTASSYDMVGLSRVLEDEKIPFKRFDSVLYFALHDTTHVFVFAYGCYVIWNSHVHIQEQVRQLCQPVSQGILEHPIKDQCQVQYGQQTTIHYEEDMIELESQDTYILFSFSHGLAQSVKLNNFEQVISNIIKDTRFIPDQIKKYGKTTLSRQKLSQLIGALFQARNSINLDCDLLNTPDFFWKRPCYEPYYFMSAKYIDLNKRLDILNKRLDVIHELHNFLSTELKHAHSSFLEWIVILLISMEVILTVLKDIVKMF
ncbi:MAG: RMD1 family protein [Alphaproteobacteria bacterium]|nr:RMD1 family protein [Alphaproteobacteria bacterium]